MHAVASSEPQSPTSQEFIFRTFNVGNYDLLKHLPENVREQQVG